MDEPRNGSPWLAGEPEPSDEQPTPDASIAFASTSEFTQSFVSHAGGGGVNVARGGGGGVNFGRLASMAVQEAVVRIGVSAADHDELTKRGTTDLAASVAEFKWRLALDRAAPVSRGEITPSRAASQLLGWATMLLPRSARLRWLEEWRGELYDLRADAEPWWRRAAYVIDVVFRSGPHLAVSLRLRRGRVTD